MKSLHVLDPCILSESARGLCALAVMTKAPQAGQVKTRLVPLLTPEQAAELNKCFLHDTAAAISNAITGHKACGLAVYTPIGAESAYDDIFSSNFSLLPQRGKEFGERLYLAAQDLFQCGFKSVCLIDSDSPTVSAENFAQAVKLLLRPGDRTVLGPCADGGYYLIGLKKPYRELFDRIDWSTERVLAQTMQRVREIGLDVELLKPGYDVDDAASLRRLCNELLGCAASPDIAPHTRRFLRELMAHKEL